MKLGAYTACLHDRSLPETLKILRELGLTSAEINAGGFIPAPHLPGQPGHGHDAPDAEQAGQRDRPAQILGVLRAHFGIGVQRVAVDVQPGQRDPGLLELAQVVRGRDVTGQQLPAGRCGAGMKPPALISALVSPSSRRIFRVSGRDLSCRHAV